MRDNGWACDGRNQPFGCFSKITGFRQTSGMNRFRCENEKCDFDLCYNCVINYSLDNVALVSCHPHPL